MTLRRILRYGDPVLLEPARPIETVDDELRALAGDMIETMRAERGVGLAAEQIGLTRAICVVEVPEEYDVDEEGNRLNPGLAMPLVLVNPEILAASPETSTLEEGCLSFPGITGVIRRPVHIRLRYTDLEGDPHEVGVRDFASRVIQHEVDHLRGVLFTTRMSPAKRVALKGRLRRMGQETRVSLGLA